MQLYAGPSKEFVTAATRNAIADLDKNCWIGDRSQSHDRVVRQHHDRFLDLVRNTYRVLLTRGMKGCYVHCMDGDTARFFRTRMEAGRE
jgi:DUF2075 family protein